MWVVTWRERDVRVFTFRDTLPAAHDWASQMADRWNCRARVVPAATWTLEHP
jgi:hypothetical protein